MIEETADVVNKERIQLFRDFLLVGKVQRSFEWDPKE
jgi:hypothetical protein